MRHWIFCGHFRLCDHCRFSTELRAVPGFRDTKRPIEDRITDLIGRLTLEEKAQQLNHTNKGLPRLGLPAWGGWNQTLHGVWSKEPTTLFPIPTAMGATWDPDLIHSVAVAMSDEGRALYNAKAEGPRTTHGLVFRSPVINISRDPRWGRIQEVFSEDPYLTGRMAVAYVRGLQGDDINHLKLAATVKHFAVNNVETGRQHLSATVDERNLFEYWLPHWRDAIMEAHAQSVMSSYNAINGTPDAVNHYLLTDILRGKWGFDGFVTDDLGAVQLLTETRRTEVGQRFSEDPVYAAAMAIKAGNDSDDPEFERNLPLAVKRGLLTEKELDHAVRNVLRVGFRLGAFDPPEDSPYSKIGMDVVRSPEHLKLSDQVGAESMTLLLNRQNFLPLDKDEDQVRRRHRPCGGRRLRDRQLLRHTLPQGQRRRAVSNLFSAKASRSSYEKGAGYIDPLDQKAIDHAADLARKSDVVVLCLGTNLRVEAEGRDRRNLDLPGAQEQLLEAVYAANPKTVLVLENAGPLAVTWAHDHLPAILCAWYPGEGGGDTIARTLFGVNNPGGHLPYTVYPEPRWRSSAERVRRLAKGYTYMYFKGVPLYPFGHGLSYTTFTYSNLKVTQSGAKLTVTFDLKNSGDRAGAEVAQLYTHQRSQLHLPAHQEPSRLPACHTRSWSESKTVTLEIPVKQLAYYDAKIHDFRVEPGIFDVLVGSSSDDIRLRGETNVKTATAISRPQPKN